MNLFRIYYQNILDIEKFPIIRNHLMKIAKKLHVGLQNHQDYLLQEINNYHPNYLGQSIEELEQLEFSFDDCKTTIAQEYGFSSWKIVAALKDLTYNTPFEKAANCIVDGNVQQLEYWLTTYPKLISQTSQYGHQATLLHYTASNGVEIWRQSSPSNLKAITKLLLGKGADKNATMKVYGGEFTAWELFTTSAHPYEAGVGEVALLLK